MRPTALVVVVLCTAGCIESDTRRTASTAPDSTTTSLSDATVDGEVASTDTSLDTSGRDTVTVCTGCSIGPVCVPFGTGSPTDPCLVCRAEEPDHWSPQDHDTPCDDRDDCHTDGVCVAGKCQVEVAQSCLPTCATSGTCSGHQCSYTLVDGMCFIDGVCVGAAADPANGCQVCDPQRDAFAWSPKDCDDQLACTLDSCENGTCKHDPKRNKCSIDGKCFDEGERQAGKPCAACIVATSQSAWSVPVEEACDDGDVCTSGDVCEATGSCAGHLVTIDGANNDTLATAQQLGAQGIASFPQPDQLGNLNPTSDVDWYTWRMTLFSGAQDYQPRASLAIAPGPSTRLCLLATCGDTVGQLVPPAVSCVEGTSGITDGTAAGCCATRDSGSIDLTIAPQCAAAGTATVRSIVYAQVSFAANSTVPCASYTLKWGAMPVPKDN